MCEGQEWFTGGCDQVGLTEISVYMETPSRWQHWRVNYIQGTWQVQRYMFMTCSSVIDI